MTDPPLRLFSIFVNFVFVVVFIFCVLFLLLFLNPNNCRQQTIGNQTQPNDHNHAPKQNGE